MIGVQPANKAEAREAALAALEVFDAATLHQAEYLRSFREEQEAQG